MKDTKFTNSLIHSSSPYLLQHAHNPVNWYEWGTESTQKAIDENKPIIVSIGYSACHWCHVMERECFENETLAKIMNEYFVCIKVDREERPDIDAIYMDALQNMGLRGGWPLNVFLTSDAKPFYGGTYFPPQQWQNILLQVAQAYRDNKEDLEKSAESFKESLNKSEIEKYGLNEIDTSITKAELESAFERFAKNFDTEKGGMNKAPKFPMPSNYLFLLRLWRETGNKQALDHVILTLKHMAMGGIYDQAGGGFARYSTDEIWFLPHFEKMLYDNGQLVSLYSEAYLATKEPLFKRVVYDTIAYIQRELTDAEGGFWSALDADSEGEEGKFYVWTQSEIDQIAGKNAKLIRMFYNIQEEGNWEHGNNILCTNTTIEEFCVFNQLDINEFALIIQQFHVDVLAERAKRVRPGLDDKVLTSWNGLMLNGLVTAYRVFDEPDFLEMALKNALFIEKYLSKDQKLYHSYKKGSKPIVGFLEDYSFVIQAYINLYQATFDEFWISRAEIYAQYVMEAFVDENEPFFYFTDASGEALIARKKELFDNVIPASNSQMAINLHDLGILLDHAIYRELSEILFGKIKKMLLVEPNYLSNWGLLALSLVSSTKEIAVSGKDFLAFRKEIDSFYFPNKLMVGTASKSELPLLVGRDAQNETLIYVCENKTCQLPVKSIEDALKQIQQN